MVRLSNRKGREPTLLKSDVKPAYVEMYYKHGSYYFSLVYKVEVPPKQRTGKVIAIDMGEIHPIVSHDGEQTLIYNDRKLRTLKQDLNKIKSHYAWEYVKNCIIILYYPSQGNFFADRSSIGC